jgi:hypothetical protein
MPFLTNTYIETALGGAVVGAAKYAAVAPTPAVKSQYISMADIAVVSAARKGGYSTVTSTGPVPVSGEAFSMLQAMAFKVWLRLAYGYGREINVDDSIDSALPNASALYVSADNGRIDLPGMSRDPLGGDAGVDLQNGGVATTQSVQLFTRDKLPYF